MNLLSRKGFARVYLAITRRYGLCNSRQYRVVVAPGVEAGV